MVVGIGIELVGLRAFERAIRRSDPDLEAVLTAPERAYCDAMASPVPHLAARWAAKRAFRKAIGDVDNAFRAWHELEVARDELGKPGLRVTGSLSTRLGELGVRRVHLSLTHTDEDAVAVVVLET